MKRTYQIEAKNEWHAKSVVEALLTKYRYLGICDSFRTGRLVSIVFDKSLDFDTYQSLNRLFLCDSTQ